MGSKPRGISASRGAAVLGFSEFQTPFEIWQLICEERQPGFNAARGYVLPPDPDSAAIRWGSAFEGAIIELAAEARGKGIICRERFNETSDGIITCHLDGIYEGTDIVIHEGKTASAIAYRNKWGEPGSDKIPRPYQVQVQHQMYLAGSEEAVVSVLVFPEMPDKWEKDGWRTASFDGGAYELENETRGGTVNPSRWARVLSEMGYFHQYRVKAKRDAQAAMFAAYREFWTKHVLAGVPPEPRDYADIKRLCPEPKSTIVVPRFIERKIEEYKGITEESARAKARKEHLKTVITKYAAASGDGVIDDESKEAVIFRSESGDKLGSWYKTKSGSLVFRC